MHTLPAQYFSDPGYTDSGVSPDTIFLLGGGLVQIFGHLGFG